MDKEKSILQLDLSSLSLTTKQIVKVLIGLVYAHPLFRYFVNRETVSELFDAKELAWLNRTMILFLIFMCLFSIVMIDESQGRNLVLFVLLLHVILLLTLHKPISFRHMIWIKNRNKNKQH